MELIIEKEDGSLSFVTDAGGGPQQQAHLITYLYETLRFEGHSGAQLKTTCLTEMRDLTNDKVIQMLIVIRN